MIKNQHTRALIIGDVHARFAPFAAAVEYARANQMFLISLGDLCDENEDGPAVYQLMAQLINQGQGVSLMGNHEWKIFRWMQGNPVKLTNGNQITVDQLRADLNFVKDFTTVFHHSRWASSTRANQIVPGFGDPALNLFWAIKPGRKRMLALAHGSVHTKSWKTATEVWSNRDRQAFIFGETNGKFYEYNGRQLPVRTYGWVDHVPSDVNLFVGHDMRAFLPQPVDGELAPPRSQPLLKTNNAGGQVWFMDTGCGKGGTLSGAVYNLAAATVEDILNFGA
jgi:hypothetical protein